jgi:hypothetical protein
MKDRDTKSREMEILIVESLVKINPTEPLTGVISWIFTLFSVEPKRPPSL